MRKFLILAVCLLAVIAGFAQLYNIIFAPQQQLINKKGTTILTRFNAPAGYTIKRAPQGSFGYYLQHLPLKKAGMPALNYKGNIARTDDYTAAVADMDIGTADLQQCADAVMRLRAEYLYSLKKYNDISFNFTSGFKCDYKHYADGYRYQNNRWVLKAKKDYGYSNFRRYLTLVFSYAGTLSLDKELKKVGNAANLQIGDIFIRGGSPGHCFIVMNIAEAGNRKLFLLAQSFMPAQDIQVLQDANGPWFNMNVTAGIPYAELINTQFLKRF